MHPTDTAIKAIRSIDKITCSDIQEILNVIAAKMQSAGFSDLDLSMIDEANGFITGEKIAPVDRTLRQCEEEGAVQRFEAWMREFV